ncbi:hypothetical protein C8A05DRAFT_20543, partial [Staphylotrichum tortipilum]
MDEFLHLPNKVIVAKTGAGGAGIDDCPSAEEGRNAHPCEPAPTVPNAHIVAPSDNEKRHSAPELSRPSSDYNSRKRPGGPEQGAVQSSHESEPLFGRLNVAATAEEADEQRKIAAYLAGKLPIVHSINSKDAKLVTAREQDGRRTEGEETPPPHPSSQTNRRLGTIHKRTQEWRFVGCELCFAHTGQREPDHGLEDCERWGTSEAARRVLQWLERLSIPRYYGQRGSCAMCGHGWVVCGEMLMRFQLDEAAGRRREDRVRLIAKYDSAKGNDGFCENRSVVRRMIAALLTYDDQILGKVLTGLVLDHYGVDLGDEKKAKGWFEQRVRSTDGYWVSRLLHALDLLILAFDWQLKQRR